MSSWVAVTVVDVGHEYIIELRGAKKMKMLRMMVNFRKGSLEESEQVSHSLPNTKTGKSKSRKEKGRVQEGSESVPWCGLKSIEEHKKASWEKQLN